MSPRFVTQHGFQTRKLDRPIQVHNVDRTVNSAGSITHKVDLIMYYQGHKESTTFDICELGQLDIIIGTPWLQRHNPEIDWNTGKVKMTRCPQTCGGRKKEIRDTRRWRKADRWDLMEYLWDKEKSDDFAYWLEDKRERDAKQNYWEQMKDPKGYFNCNKYPWVPLPKEELHTQEHGAWKRKLLRN